MKAETYVVARIIAAINTAPHTFVWRNQSGSVRAPGGYVHMAPAGSPDVVGWTRGKFLGIEVKVEGNRTSKERAAKQAEWRERIRAAGGIAFEARSAQEAVDLLRAALGEAA
ncbi:MAG TPA: hypothetical protein VGM06_10510 [Polyangiaceae bacterium]|jgi:Holliday junction resolvase